MCYLIRLWRQLKPNVTSRFREVGSTFGLERWMTRRLKFFQSDFEEHLYHSTCECVPVLQSVRGGEVDLTMMSIQLNKAIWSVWSTSDPRTDNILFAEFNSTGPGIAGASRPSFATLLNSSQAAAYTIATTVGSDFAEWVDQAYLA